MTPDELLLRDAFLSELWPVVREWHPGDGALRASRSVTGNLPSNLRTVETHGVSDVTVRVRCERMGGHKKNGPGGVVAHPGNPGPDPRSTVRAVLGSLP